MDLSKKSIEELKDILSKLDNMIKLNAEILEINKFRIWENILSYEEIDILPIITRKKEEIVKELYFIRGVKFQ